MAQYEDSTFDMTIFWFPYGEDIPDNTDTYPVDLAPDVDSAIRQIVAANGATYLSSYDIANYDGRYRYAVYVHCDYIPDAEISEQLGDALAQKLIEMGYDVDTSDYSGWGYEDTYEV